jgi:hypothetical protein
MKSIADLEKLYSTFIKCVVHCLHWRADFLSSVCVQFLYSLNPYGENSSAVTVTSFNFATAFSKRVAALRYIIVEGLVKVGGG